MRIAMVGVTRGMGRELARRFAERGDSIVLWGRDQAGIDAMRADLQIRGAREVHVGHLDLADPSGFDAAVAEAAEALGRLDAVVITAGLFGTQDDLEADPARCAAVLDVNFTKTVLLCEVARKHLLAQGGGTLAVLSSVAGDAARKTVGLYGASKAGLSHYLSSLDLRYHANGLRVVCVRPGFVRTGMTDGLKEPPFAADVGEAVDAILAAFDRQAPVAYAPGIWRWVMLVIRHLPRFVMRRVGF